MPGGLHDVHCLFWYRLCTSWPVGWEHWVCCLIGFSEPDWYSFGFPFSSQLFLSTFLILRQLVTWVYWLWRRVRFWRLRCCLEPSCQLVWCRRLSQLSPCSLNSSFRVSFSCRIAFYFFSFSCKVFTICSLRWIYLWLRELFPSSLTKVGPCPKRRQKLGRIISQ